MKHPGIVNLRNIAERDYSISDGALRLLLRVCSFVFMDPRRLADAEFPLPWSQVAVWCGLKDDKAAYNRLRELADPRRPGGPYIEKAELRGCPPTQFYRLNLTKKPPTVTRSNCPPKGAIKHPQNGANVTPGKGAINTPAKGAHQISNSLRNKDFKKEEENNGSLRSVRGGVDNSVSAIAPTKSLTAEERSQEIARLRESLGG